MFQARWWPWHALCAVIVAALAFLGYWQMQVAFNPGEWHGEQFSIRNFVYALQWWVFALFAFWFWYRYMRDQRQAEAGVASEDQAIARANSAFGNSAAGSGGAKGADATASDDGDQAISLDAPASERRKQIFGDRSGDPSGDTSADEQPTTDEQEPTDGNKESER